MLPKSMNNELRSLLNLEPPICPRSGTLFGDEKRTLRPSANKRLEATPNSG